MQFRKLGQITKEYNAKQWKSSDLLEELSVEFGDKKLKIGDLGCGQGKWYDKLKVLFPNVDYYGIDIATSNEAKSRTRKDIKFTEYDANEAVVSTD